MGLSSELPFFKPTNMVRGNPRVTHTTIYKCDNFAVRLVAFIVTNKIGLINYQVANFEPQN